MKKHEMVQHGKTLTDREYGKKVALQLLKESSFPLVLDFRGVFSLGSSCGDEILTALAPKQKNRIYVTNANGAIQSCLEKVVEDANLTLEFV